MSERSYITNPILPGLARWTNPEDSRTIGIRSGASLRVQTLTDDGTENVGWTKNLDIEKYAHGAVVSLVNGSGGALTLIEIGLLGRPVTIQEGEAGLVHDSLADRESINQEGEKLYEGGSDYIVDVTQLKEIADYFWKIVRGNKHQYTLELPGTRYDFRPGTRHVMNIGAAGETEYLNSVVEVLSVETDRSWKGIGSTRIMLREVEEQWKYSSNAIARTVASGIYQGSKTQTPAIVVAALHYIGRANVFCDGVNDEIEINKAIAELAENDNGGVVLLTRGKFLTGGSIVLNSGVWLKGEGNQTIVERNHTSTTIGGTGLSEFQISDFKISRDSGSGGTTNHITLGGCTDFTITGMTIDDAANDGISLVDCDRFTITKNNFVDNGLLANDHDILMQRCDEGNVIDNNFKDSMGHAIAVITAGIVTILGNNINNPAGIGIDVSGATGSRITNNYIVSAGTDGIISTDAARIIISNNTILSVSGDGIKTDNVDDSVVSGNVVQDCGDDGIIIDNGSDDNTIAGNIVEGNAGTGILINSSDCDNTIINSNTSRNNGVDFTDNGTNTFGG